MSEDPEPSIQGRFPPLATVEVVPITSPALIWAVTAFAAGGAFALGQSPAVAAVSLGLVATLASAVGVLWRPASRLASSVMARGGRPVAEDLCVLWGLDHPKVTWLFWDDDLAHSGVSVGSLRGGLVLLPTDLAVQDPMILRAVMCHEGAHLVRGHHRRRTVRHCCVSLAGVTGLALAAVLGQPPVSVAVMLAAWGVLVAWATRLLRRADLRAELEADSDAAAQAGPESVLRALQWATDRSPLPLRAGVELRAMILRTQSGFGSTTGPDR